MRLYIVEWKKTENRTERWRKKSDVYNDIGILLKALIYVAPMDSATEYLNITKHFKQPSCCTCSSM